DVVLDRLLDHLSQLVPYDSANVMLLDADGRLVTRAARGYERFRNPAGARAGVFEGALLPAVVGPVLAGGRSVLLSDVRHHPGWERKPGGEHVMSWLGVPLLSRGRAIGLYSLDKAEPGFFTEEHQALTEALAPQAVVAIENARLYERSQRAVE